MTDDIRAQTLYEVNKSQTIHKLITDRNGDRKKLFNIVNSLLGRQKQAVFPDCTDPITLASTFNMLIY